MQWVDRVAIYLYHTTNTLFGRYTMTKVKVHQQPCNSCGRGKDEGEGWTVASSIGFTTNYKHDTCPERVCRRTVGDTWSRHACGRDGKEQDNRGEWLCGIHFAAYNKRQATSTRYADKHSRSQFNLDRARTALEILTELGVEGAAHYNSDGHTGNIVIDPADLFKLIGVGAKLPEKQAIEE